MSFLLVRDTNILMNQRQRELFCELGVKSIREYTAKLNNKKCTGI